MLVVADTSPFIGLIKIGLIDVQPKLYGSVIIPTEVADELRHAKRPMEVKAFAAAPPDWLVVKPATNVELIDELGAGERAAISLARELKAEVLLIDEALGRQAAIERGIKTTRTAAILLEAAKIDAIADLAEAYEKLKATNFRVPADALTHFSDSIVRPEDDRDR